MEAEDARKMVGSAPENEAEAGVEVESEEGGLGPMETLGMAAFFYGKHVGQLGAPGGEVQSSSDPEGNRSQLATM